ncbi:MAG TPA: hypothetical protein K8V30_09555 [Metalysinibacillus jejuensis]|uniref:Uncharacterized protein n=1 Tax=Metalysinibacillus jejuensis TaxID=914327 RepID=A0A921T5W1_9BACL|nr:hypothetical protein [Metalysinibacillus jejuensis]
MKRYLKKCKLISNRGSEDGEYAYCEGHLFMHFDGATIDARAQAPNFVQFTEE